MMQFTGAVQLYSALKAGNNLDRFLVESRTWRVKVPSDIFKVGNNPEAYLELVKQLRAVFELQYEFEISYKVIDQLKNWLDKIDKYSASIEDKTELLLGLIAGKMIHVLSYTMPYQFEWQAELRLLLLSSRTSGLSEDIFVEYIAKIQKAMEAFYQFTRKPRELVEPAVKLPTSFTNEILSSGPVAKPEPRRRPIPMLGTHPYSPQTAVGETAALIAHFRERLYQGQDGAAPIQERHVSLTGNANSKGKLDGENSSNSLETGQIQGAHY